MNDNVNTAFNSSLMLLASHHQTDTAKAHLAKTHTKQWKSLKSIICAKNVTQKALGYHSCVKVSPYKILCFQRYLKQRDFYLI